MSIPGRDPRIKVSANAEKAWLFQTLVSHGLPGPGIPEFSGDAYTRLISVFCKISGLTTEEAMLAFCELEDAGVVTRVR